MPMTSHHVTGHVIAVSHASSLSKRKEKENKISIKSENKIKIVHVQSIPQHVSDYAMGGVSSMECEDGKW